MDQLTTPAPDETVAARLGFTANGGKVGELLRQLDGNATPVSYTHLTLPTKRIV